MSYATDMAKKVATVMMSSLAESKGPRKLWGFGYADLAALLKIHPTTVRRLVAEGEIDPSDLMSIFRFIAMRRPLPEHMVWVNVRRSDVVREVAKLAGFDDIEVDETAQVFETLHARGKSPGTLLTAMAQREGKEWSLIVKGPALRFRRTNVGRS